MCCVVLFVSNPNPNPNPKPNPNPNPNRVYFFLPPTQQEVLKTGRKVKHLMHYRGPVTVIKLIPGRRRQYEIEFLGKTFKRDVGMLIPEQTILEIDVTTLDPTRSLQDSNKPQLYTNGEALHEDMTCARVG